VRAVLTRDEMRAADAAALSTVSHETLVTRAGTAVAGAALRLLGGAYGRRVVVVAGKGSNGADGRVAAEVLARRGARVLVVDAGDAVAAPDAVLPACDLVIDGAYGTGFRGSYDAPRPPVGARVLAIDIPSGVDADSGEAPGDAVRAERTVTFAALKPGLLQGAGARCAGALEVADIGIGFPTPRALLVDDADLALVPKRPRGVNKWTTAVGVAAGSAGMEGAAVLCTRGAMAAGAGMIRLGSPGDPVAAWPTEAVRMHLPASRWAGAFADATAKCKAIVIGPGLGTDAGVAAEIRAVLAAVPVPVVIDADALRALGDAETARRVLEERSAPSILTPHDGEYARLSGSAPGEDRLGAARRLAAATGAVVLLKGPLTAVADPAGAAATPDVLLADAGGPSLATAGSGDVLSGIIAAFCARGVAPFEAAALAAHVHGRAAGRGPAEGLVAGDLPALVAQVLSGCGGEGGEGGEDGEGAEVHGG
jgi:ADP-dependent NAD(P)H-hydrate dehydratase / NAD(P)H-hydrate epimerase